MKISFQKENFLNILISLSILIISFCLFCVPFFIVEKEVSYSRLRELKSHERRVVKLEDQLVDHQFKTILSDLYYLSHSFKNPSKSPTHQKWTLENWVEFSTHRHVYDQIRFLDVSGQEQIRINLSKQKAFSVPNSFLQNKGDRYYFQETIKLDHGDIYISPLDLNVENGEIELPYKPMVRFGMPIYENGLRQGIVMLNYKAENFLKTFQKIGNESHGDVFLLNENGYWLSSRDSNLEWGFMFPQKSSVSFPSHYPKAWKSLLNGTSSVQTENGLFSFTTVHLEDKIRPISIQNSRGHIHIGSKKWYVVSYIPLSHDPLLFTVDDTPSFIRVLLKRKSYYFAFALGISLFVSILVYVNRQAQLRLRHFSQRDMLTGVYNRRAGLSKLHALALLKNRRQNFASLCFLDVNGLKTVNDTFGHEKGDELLKTVSTVLMTSVRKHDFIIRMGGDEFLIVFYNTSVHNAESIWERILHEFSIINSEKKLPYMISVSHGIVEYDNTKKISVNDLIHFADQKMYAEKRKIKQSSQLPLDKEHSEELDEFLADT